MSYCLNPACPQPKNPMHVYVCQACGSNLLLRDRYRIIKALGQGGFGATFVAQDESLPGHPGCVIKQFCPARVPPQLLQMAQELFMREAKTLGTIGNHPQLPRLLDFFQDNEQFYLVQEYISGSTLKKEVERDGPFSEAGVKQFLSEILPLLQYIHSQYVIHRDIKPANIIRREQDRKVVLIDFGAVKNQVNPTAASNSDETELINSALDNGGTDFSTFPVKNQVNSTAASNSDDTALTNFAIGTPGFAPPEQMALRPVYASDIYALGVTCIYLLTGKSPKDLDYDPSTGEMVWLKLVEVSDRFAAILNKMLEVSVRHRYQSATEVLEALQPLITLYPTIELADDSNSVFVAYSLRMTLSSNPVLIGGELEVAIQLSLADNNDTTYLLEIPRADAIGGEVNIFLTAPGFQFNGDDAINLSLGTGADGEISYQQVIQTARFHLTALRPGSTTIKAELYCGETFKKSLETKVQVSGFDAAELRPLNAARSRPVPQPDLIVQVRTAWNEDISACTFRYHLDTFQSRLLFADESDYCSESLSARWIERSHLLLKSTLEDAASSLPEDFRSRLASLGQYLFQFLLPAELQSIFRSIVGFNRPFTLLILADQDAWFPWELLHDGQSFLGDRFTLLGRTCDLTNGNPCDPLSDDLLKYLYKASHNMLHFACHCQEGKRGDTLLISFIKDEEIEENALVLELETYKFLLRQGQFLCQPLVFLNACQSAGGADELRRTFNLPKVFIQHGAAAVIATACPVPDLFAAAFARVFYEFFLRGLVVEDEGTGEKGVRLMTIGEALRATRWYFVKEFNNPLGLAYGLYSPAHYRLGRVPAKMI